jgi:hypothetical protein
MQPQTSDVQSNLPNASLMYSSFTPIFGNLNFQIAPSMTGEVNFSFGQIPYLSLEALIYQQQMQAQVSPTNIQSGQNTGQQNIQGQYTVTDNAGNQRMVAGYSAGAF